MHLETEQAFSDPWVWEKPAKNQGGRKTVQKCQAQEPTE